MKLYLLEVWWSMCLCVWKGKGQGMGGGSVGCSPTSTRLVVLDARESVFKQSVMKSETSKFYRFSHIVLKACVTCTITKSRLHLLI